MVGSSALANVGQQTQEWAGFAKGALLGRSQQREAAVSSGGQACARPGARPETTQNRPGETERKSGGNQKNYSLYLAEEDHVSDPSQNRGGNPARTPTEESDPSQARDGNPGRTLPEGSKREGYTIQGRSCTDSRLQGMSEHAGSIRQ